MPIKGGLELQEYLSQLPLRPPIIFMSGSAELPTAVKAMQDGANDFLQKPFKIAKLSKSIESALASDAANRERHTRARELADLFANLNSAEHNVLQLVLAGETNKKSAVKLDVSLRTVEDRRSRIMNKLNVDNMADLFRIAIEAGMCEGS